MARIEWTTEAETRLRGIYDFIARDKPEAALRLVEAIFRRTETLREFPELGYRYAERPHENVRILLYGHYRIPYLITPSSDIRILGVFHGAMEMHRYLEWGR